MAHSAVAVPKTLPGGQCSAGTTVAVNQRRYLASCNDQRILNDTNARPVTFHEDSLEACVARCRAFNMICSAMGFDVTMASGYMNCHLFRVLPPPGTFNTGYTFLYSEEFAANYTAPPPKHYNQQKDWILIVALVLGGLVTLVVIISIAVHVYKRQYCKERKKKAI